MRVFIAIEFNGELKEFFNEIKLQAKDLSAGGNFTHKDNIHLTLKFIGEADEKSITAIKEAMKETVEMIKSFTLLTKELGTFSRKSKHILWLGVGGEMDKLKTVYNELEDVLDRRGFNKEERPYSPHITLGRQVIIEDLDSIKDKIRMEEREIMVDSISLMESKREKGALVYKAIYRCSLQ
ncbi:RNA 2',3'-cyclic phosphodiesterase [Alkaliphilus serpentinus]|uniref:RNA 2',3'-cyclic phosphodiesterase n=1 Tax=Alkaliphilus serpentinus TaxID=1482731 RepID=A0A833HP76_9FIRM|nr:RNA 2',3'-cyclic phosphodiesterase [Alkaliphilus serpentinus]KAB3530444.1 RNA 2',3'-cyclic phosphodiesterase [Alkaliphilus serpentinus]